MTPVGYGNRVDSNNAALLTVAAFGAGWAVLYAPVYLEFAQFAWRREENGHVPFIMAICLGTAWARLSGDETYSSDEKSFAAGLGVLAAGFGLYLLGRAGEIDLFSSASQSVIALGGALALLGFAGARALWFPLLLSLYLIIWPGWAIEAATAPLKIFIADVVSTGLFAAGLPVAHSGAVISAGPYELLVAEACAGINSFIALTAVGAVYLFTVKRRSLAANVAVLVALAPIAIIANLIRVALLILLTYYFGYDVGQSFLHEAAGLVMFASALFVVFAVDSAAAFLWDRTS